MPNQVAYGFVSLQDVFANRVSTIGVEVLRTAIQQSSTAYNTEINLLLDNWSERSTVSKELVELAGSGTMQPLDEWGNPLPVKPSGSYDVGYPIQGAGTAWGTNRVSAALLTVEEANRYTADAFQRDATWVRQHMLAAILDNTQWVYKDKKLGDLTVVPLANGDATQYLKTGATDDVVDNHYFAQAGAISDAANPFPKLYDALIEHASNADPYVVYVPTNLAESIEGLASFVPQSDPDIVQATTRDRLANSGSAQVRGPGHSIIGKSNRLWIVEWRSLPDNYMLAVATGSAPFLRMREYDATGLQGLFPEFHSPDGNLIENRFVRYAGFGVKNRLAAAVYQIGSAAYTIPTGFVTPLP